MSLDNINCPQFVDFTSKNTFDINDGADFCFDYGIVGELVDLGNFSKLNITEEPVKVITLNQSPLTLKDSTNFQNDKKITPKQKKEPLVLKIENKPSLVEKTIAKVNSVLPKLNKLTPKPKVIQSENIPPRPRIPSASKPIKIIHDPKIIKAPPLNLNRTRTYSKNETIIIDVPAKIDRKSRPRNPIEQNVNRSNLLQRPSSTDRTLTNQPMYKGIMFVPKLQSRGSSVKSSNENLNDLIKNRPPSLNRGFVRNVSKTPVRKNPALNISTNASLNGSKLRSGSGSGLLHTELRAYKRIEYERLIKEKERVASMVKKDLESSRIQIEHEELKKIRSNSIVRSNPIRHYKPIIVKPSSKPLTNPISPNLSARSFCFNH